MRLNFNLCVLCACLFLRNLRSLFALAALVEQTRVNRRVWSGARVRASLLFPSTCEGDYAWSFVEHQALIMVLITRRTRAGDSQRAARLGAPSAASTAVPPVPVPAAVPEGEPAVPRISAVAKLAQLLGQGEAELLGASSVLLHCSLG